MARCIIRARSAMKARYNRFVSAARGAPARGAATRAPYGIRCDATNRGNSSPVAPLAARAKAPSTVRYSCGGLFRMIEFVFSVTSAKFSPWSNWREEAPAFLR